jgi:nucleoside-diphosphate-sugar epimerase
MLSNILIIGATGVIGKPITDQILSAKSTFGRIAILTSNNTANSKADEIKALKEQGVEVLVGDLGVEDDVKRAYDGESMSRNCGQSCSDSS